MQHPKISVIIPIYNVSLYLPQCLDSLIRQTFSDFEILCIDDASTDHSVEIVKSYQQKDPRILLIRQEHRGVSVARNLGLQHACGQYVIFIDADDWVEDNLLESMLKTAADSDCDVVVCSAQVHFSPDSTFPRRRQHALQHSLLVQDTAWTSTCVPFHTWQVLKRPGNWPFIWNKLIRKSILDRNAVSFSPALALGEDGVFLQILYQYVHKVAFLSSTLYHYRYQRKSSATVSLAQDLSVRFRHHIDVVSELTRELSARCLLQQNGAELLHWILHFLYSDYLRLPADARERASSDLLALFADYELMQFSTCLASIYQNRLSIMLHSGKDFTKTELLFQIYKTKIENRTIRFFQKQ